MTRSYDSAAIVAMAGPVTAPLYLIAMDFEPCVYFSTRETYSWDGRSWLAAGVELSRPGSINPSVSVFNEDTLFGQLVLTKGTAGRSVKIWQAERLSVGYSTPQMIFAGQMGPGSVGTNVVIQCRRGKPSRSPRHYIESPVFNHLPKSGTRIETPKGVFVLESR